MTHLAGSPKVYPPLILLLCCICLAKRLNIHERHFSRNIPNGRFSSVIGRNPRWGNAINAAKPPFFRVQCMHTHFRGRRRRKKGLLSSQHLVDEHACQPASQPGQSRQGGKAVKSSIRSAFVPCNLYWRDDHLFPFLEKSTLKNAQICIAVVVP